MNKYKKYHREYYLKNKKKIIRRTKIYHNKHKKQRDEYFKQYRKNHKRKAHNYSKIWRYTIKGIYIHLKDKSMQRNIKFNIKQEDFITWYNNQDKICVYCKRTEKEIINDKNKKSYRLSIDRKDNNIGYTLDNIVLACYRCNMIKSAEFTFAQMLKIGKFLQKL
jgi:hypothetical protein